MHLENIVVDAHEPLRLGAFWEAALGCERLTSEPDIVETRLSVDGGPVLDLCFPRVAEPAPAEPRLHLDLRGGAQQAAVVERLVGLGAAPLDIGQGDVPWVVLADPEGNPFCVMEEREVYVETGQIAALVLESADPGRDAAFWAWLTGWQDAPGAAPRTLRHPTHRGVLLELTPERAAKSGTKNRLHLDVRLEQSDDADLAVAGIVERGGRELHPGWGDLPWRVCADPSGNEVCLLPAHA